MTESQPFSFRPSVPKGVEPQVAKEAKRKTVVVSSAQALRVLQPTQAIRRVWTVMTAVMLCWSANISDGGELQLQLKHAEQVTFVGAYRRWDADGNPRKPVNPKAKIDAPEVDAEAEFKGDGVWTFRNLPAGRYDLVLLAKERIRFEGFHYPPIIEFDPTLPSTAPVPSDEVRDWIRKDIAAAKHYENKVTPLFMAGDRKQVRVFVQLLRDDATSFDADFGAPVATLRHEFWQYTNRAGGWVKERKTKVVDRILMAKADLQRWTWIWIPELGGIEVGDGAVRVAVELPKKIKP